jgi:hypothetical protein
MHAEVLFFVLPVAHLRPSSLTWAILASVILIALPSDVYAQPGLADASGAARLVSFTGQISWLHDGTAWALNAGDTVPPLQMIVTGPDGYGVFKISDGSTFEVFPNSRVVFRENRGDWKDLLEVWLGKVRVQIEHFGGLPNNNRVRTPSAVISVRGTVFDVEVEDSNQTTLVVDEEGSVEVRHLLKPSTRILNAGEFVRVYKDDPLAKAVIDKGSALRKAFQAASDAFYQAALNASRGAQTVGRGVNSPGGTTGGSPGDKNNGVGNTNGAGSTNAPPAPPPPPPAPPQ